jgi:PncC family amidohydrolase
MKKNQQLVSILRRRKKNISFAESCTGGLLSSSITSVSGSSKIFTMGLVTYSNLSKITVLDIPKSLLKKNGAVSSQCCLAMVNGLSKISNSKINVSITGIAGPNGGTKSKPVGLVYVGLKIGKKTAIKKYKFKNLGRLFIQKKTVEKTLSLIIETILNKK